jgi:16S rRNA (guanine(1405)-N(7))-methyltransferase
VNKDSSDLEKLETAVLSSGKYRYVDPGFVRSLGTQELEKRRSLKEAVKAVKNKLHQVGGAYQNDQMGYQEFIKEVETAACDSVEFKDACLVAMRRHTSTRERIPFILDFYATIFNQLPPIHSLLDVACGLNPLARPWMPIPPDCRYLAVDVYNDLAAFLNTFMHICNFPGKAWAADVIQSPPQNEVDLALILKTIPCLEQVDKHAGARLLDSLRAQFLVVSFPAHSLGGRDKGMGIHYPAHFQELASARSWGFQRFDFPGEIAFLVQK